MKDEFWERAGEQGYARTLYANEAVAHHLTHGLWKSAIVVARQLGLTEKAHVLDLGCGDGEFANHVLAKNFARVEGIDLCHAAIRRAQSVVSRSGVSFQVADITRLNYSQLPRYDAVFLMGVLHHVKKAAPAIVRNLRGVADRVIVLEPNGNNCFRKLLEFAPSHRIAGESSFRIRQLEIMFADAGFKNAMWQRRNMFPNFTPGCLFKALLPLERFLESNPILRSLCTVNLWGFVVQKRVASTS